MSEERVPKMKTLYWALKLLECFDEEHTRLGVTELSDRMSIPKSSICNALSTFEQLGYVRRHSATGKYSLGPKVLCLYHAYFTGNSDAKAYQTECKALSDRTNSIVQVAVRTGDRLICLANAHPPRYQQSNLSGSAISFHATAIGKAVLAFMDPERKNRILNEGLEAHTHLTITDREALEQELENIRRRDFAVDFMEHEYGMCSVAIPLWRSEDHRQPPRYALGITVPAERLSDDQVFDLVKILRDSHKDARSRLLSE